MRRFVILTRGRTGSSAVAEELNGHPDVVCHGELARPGVKAAGKYPIQPLRLHAGAAERPVTAAEFAAWADYLQAEAGGAKAVGFKLLDNHLKDIEGGAEALRGFAVIYLQRRDLVRQALSFMTAKARGAYNSKAEQPSREPITVEPAALNSRIRRLARLTAERRDEVRAVSDGLVEAYYEDWLAHRRRFYRPIFDLLGVADLELPPTTWQRMTAEDPSKFVANWAEVERRVRKAGLGDALDAA